MAIFAVLILLHTLVLMARRATRRWASIRQAAEYSAYATRTIRERIADGTLPAYTGRGSRLLRLDLNDVDAWLEGEGRIPTAHLGEADERKRGGDASADGGRLVS